MQYMKVPVALRLDEGLVARVDEVRGDVPRVRWIVRALEKALGDSPPSVSRSGAESVTGLARPVVSPPEPSRAPEAAVAPRSLAFVCPVASCKDPGSETPGGLCPVHGRPLRERWS